MSDEGPQPDPHRRCDYVCLAAQNARAEVTRMKAERAQIMQDLAAALKVINEEKLKALQISESMQRLNLRILC
jgi:hypothetical protein